MRDGQTRSNINPWSPIRGRNDRHRTQQGTQGAGRKASKAEASLTHIKDLYGQLSNGTESIRLHQEMLALDSKIRDRVNQADLETLELIWNNMALSQEIIRQEMENIAVYREEVKRAGS